MYRGKRSKTFTVYTYSACFWPFTYFTEKIDMTLIAEKKVSILMIGTFSIGLILGLFFAQMHYQKKSDAWLGFEAQSVDAEAAETTKKRIACPRGDVLGAGQTVTVNNPLVDKAHEIFSLQQWFISENYMLRWPSGKTIGPWKGQLAKQDIDEVVADMKWNDTVCIYRSVWKELLSLRQDSVGEDCQVVNSKGFVWFSCVQDE